MKSEFKMISVFLTGICLGLFFLHPFMKQPDHSDRQYRCLGFTLPWIDQSPILKDRICIGILSTQISN
jgi:hypothetical protein